MQELLEYLVDMGIANNTVSAQVIIENASPQLLDRIEEGYKSAFKAPTNAHPKGSMGASSPAMKMMKKSDELQKSEPGSARQKKQTKASQQMNRTFQAARNA